MTEDGLKVLYIAGSGRSGSTILHNILAQIDGFFAVGELHYIWERGFIKNRLCGCGVAFRECEMWTAIVREAFGSIDHVDVHRMFRLNRSFRIYHLPFMFIPPVKRRHTSRLSEYLDNVEKLYRAIAAVTGRRVIVDSSKTPVFGYLLRMIPGINLHVVHFVRDSRATAHSWSRKRLFEPRTGTTNPEYMAQHSPVRSALQWNARNILTEMYLRQTPVRYMRVKYEDFVDNPQDSVKGILGLLSETRVTLPFVTEHTVEIHRANHSVFGNLVRFQTGSVELGLDDEWKRGMKRSHQIAVAGLTWPMLLRYGYL